MEYLSSVMRGEQREQTLISVGEAGQEIVDIDVGAKDRIRAGTELLKRYPMDPEERKLRLERMRLENEKLKTQIGGEEGQDDKIAEFIDRLKGAVIDDN